MAEDMSDISNILAGVVAYVEVSTNACDISLEIAQQMKDLGAEICESRNTRVTHIIYRYGSQVTVNWALQHDIPVVDVDWLTACIRSKECLYYMPWIIACKVQQFRPSLGQSSARSLEYSESGINLFKRSNSVAGRPLNSLNEEVVHDTINYVAMDSDGFTYTSGDSWPSHPEYQEEETIDINFKEDRIEEDKENYCEELYDKNERDARVSPCGEIRRSPKPIDSSRVFRDLTEVTLKKEALANSGKHDYSKEVDKMPITSSPEKSISKSVGNEKSKHVSQLYSYSKWKKPLSPLVTNQSTPINNFKPYKSRKSSPLRRFLLKKSAERDILNYYEHIVSSYRDSQIYSSDSENEDVDGSDKPKSKKFYVVLENPFTLNQHDGTDASTSLSTPGAAGILNISKHSICQFIDKVLTSFMQQSEEFDSFVDFDDEIPDFE